jgi:nucleoid DNA-binding protein
MGFKYIVKEVKMNLHEETVEGYKLQLINDSIIKEESLMEYASRSAHIPKSMMKACTMAIADAISFYVINGHKVSFGDFGNFRLKVENTCVDTLKECQADTVKRTNLCFTPSKKIKEILNGEELSKFDISSTQNEESINQE